MNKDIVLRSTAPDDEFKHCEQCDKCGKEQFAACANNKCCLHEVGDDLDDAIEAGLRSKGVTCIGCD
jgi:hypothetical protein